MSADRIAAGPNGSARILFTENLGAAILWLLSPSGVFEGSLEFAAHR